MSSTEVKLDALETTTQLKINRQFLIRIEALEKSHSEQFEALQELKEKLIRLEQVNDPDKSDTHIKHTLINE